jgi:hypothetical protein
MNALHGIAALGAAFGLSELVRTLKPDPEEGQVCAYLSTGKNPDFGEPILVGVGAEAPRRRGPLLIRQRDRKIVEQLHREAPPTEFPGQTKVVRIIPLCSRAKPVSPRAINSIVKEMKADLKEVSETNEEVFTIPVRGRFKHLSRFAQVGGKRNFVQIGIYKGKA